MESNGAEETGAFTTIKAHPVGQFDVNNTFTVITDRLLPIKFNVHLHLTSKSHILIGLLNSCLWFPRWFSRLCCKAVFSGALLSILSAVLGKCRVIPTN